MAKEKLNRSGAPKARSQTKPQTAAQRLAARNRKATQAASKPTTGKQRRAKQQRGRQAQAAAQAARDAHVARMISIATPRFEAEAKKFQLLTMIAKHHDDHPARTHRALMDSFNVKLLPELLKADLPNDDMEYVVLQAVRGNQSTYDEAWKVYTAARADKANEDNGAGENCVKWSYLLHAMQCVCLAHC